MNFFLHVEEAKYVENYKVWLRFNSGEKGEIDLCDSLDGPIFRPLKEVEYFKSFHIEGNTISWDNGADFAPEYLLEKLSSNRVAEGI